MSKRFDVAVVGLGAMGSAALFQLARRGVRVLGLDRFDPPHSFGSSHGETRVIREAYFEHPSYVPLVQRAYELWEELERASGERLYIRTGGLMIGAAESTVVTGAIRSAREHRLTHEILDAHQMKKRAPGLEPEDGMFGVFEPRAGILFPERCVAAHLRLARAAGAILRTNEAVAGWESTKQGVRLQTSEGQYTASAVVIAAGAWIAKLLPELRPNIYVERQMLLWFKTPEPAEIFDVQHLPIHLWEYEKDQMFYGFPDVGDGVKVAFHHQGEITSADRVDREVRPEDVARMRELLARFMPRAAKAELLRGTVCLYTNTLDGHFILDRHPEHRHVIVGSPCSGHGFKFASAIGEALADLALGRSPAVDLSLFALSQRPKSTFAAPES